MATTEQQFEVLLERLSDAQLFDIGKNFLTRETITQALLNLYESNKEDILSSFE